MPEYRFDLIRRWRFDFAFPGHRIAMEVDGGTWTDGRHVRGSGYANDIEKLSEALCQGWMVLRVLPAHLDDGHALTWLERIFKTREDQRLAVEATEAMLSAFCVLHPESVNDGIAAAFKSLRRSLAAGIHYEQPAATRTR